MSAHAVVTGSPIRLNPVTHTPNLVSRIRGSIAAALLLMLLLLQVTPASAAEDVDAIRAATTWLMAQQSADGSFPGFSGEPDPGMTADAIVAMAAAQGFDVDVEDALRRAAVWLVANGADAATADPSQAARMTLAALAIGADPRDINGFDLIDAILNAPGVEAPVLPGAIGDNLYSHALSIIALARAGEPIDPQWIEVFRTTQAESGAWAFDGSTAPESLDSNTTALVLQAFIVAGFRDDPALVEGFAALEEFHTENGYISYLGMDADSNSTAVVLQALIANGEAADSSAMNDTLLDLAAMLNPSGALSYGNGDDSDNLFSTVQAIPVVVEYAHQLEKLCAAEGTSSESVCDTGA